MPPSFPVGLADYLRDKGIKVTPDRDLFELRRRRKDADQLAYQLVKYRQRDGWTDADVLRLAHPCPVTGEHDALFRRDACQGAVAYR